VLGRFVAAVVVRPVTTAMVTIALLLFGIVSATRLPVELLPDLSYPSISVQTVYADAAPAEVEELVTRPIEELVGAVPGVVSVESVSREGRSEVVLDFAWGTSIDDAMADVREKLDRARLPLTSERPVVLRYDPAQEPIMRLALAGAPSVDGHVDLALLRLHADRQVKRALEKLSGVAAVALHGGDEEEIRVELDPARLAALGVTGEEVVAAIRADNVNRPGGGLTEQQSRYLVRTVHEAKVADELAEIIVRSRDGAELRLKDLARVERLPVEREEAALLATQSGDGRRSVTQAVELSVYREGDANTVAVARTVLDHIGRIPLVDGEKLVVLSNQADFIEAAVHEVIENTIVGGVLAIAVLLFFLRQLRSTLVVAVAIPISLLATFVPLQVLGVSLNLMSLGGLALGVGMLVDNSIVVLESIARVRAEQPGTSARETAVTGTREVAPSVVASTLTTVAVFFPMSFLEGVAGQLVRDLSYSVSFSILSSMLVSLSLVPVLEALGAGPTASDESAPPPRSLVAWLVAVPALLWRPIRALVRMMGGILFVLSRPLVGAYAALERAYPPLLRGALRIRATVVMGGLGLCVAAIAFAQVLPRALLPDVEQREFYVQMTLPQGTSLEHTQRLTEKLLASVADEPRVRQAFARVGSITQGGSATGNLMGTHLAQVDVQLVDDPTLPVAEIEQVVLAGMRRDVAGPDVLLRLGRPALFSFDAPIEVRLFSDRLEASTEHARRILPALRAIPALEDVVPDDLAGRPEVRVAFDRERLARLGLTVDAAAGSVQRAIQGELAGVMHAADKQLDIRVQLPRVDRSRVADVSRIQVGVSGTVPVLLAAVADVRPATGPAEVRRIDGRRGFRIRARLAEIDLASVAAQVGAVLTEHAAQASGVQATIAGQAEEMQRSLLSMALTALLSVFLVYVVMASGFESLRHPFLIMFTVPMALVGVVGACSLLRVPISAMTGIGAIILGGIVVNNAIVLIDAVNQRRGRGMSVRDALLQAGAARLRPIVMTTATTVLGLLPMAMGLGEGAALRQPLAVTVIAGLSVSTLLTLVVIPCVYALFPGPTREAWIEHG
jgi:HAE1 family hydrophobic/amphiphilic exporter-1